MPALDLLDSYLNQQDQPDDHVFNALARAIRGYESGGDPDAVSSQDARGSMQIMRPTFAQYARPGESFDNDRDRTAAALRKLADDYNHYGGDPRKTAAAYIGGRGGLNADGTPRDDVADANGTTPRMYADTVLARMGRLGAAVPQSAAQSVAQSAAQPAAQSGNDLADQILAAGLAPLPGTTREPAQAGLFRTAGDVGIKLAQGAVDLGQSAVGLGSLATGGLVGQGMRAIGYDPEATNAALGEYLSDSQKAADAKVQAADGFVDATIASLQNPRSILGGAAESAPGMLAGMGLTGAVARGIAIKAALATGEGAAASAGALAAGKSAAEASAAALATATGKRAADAAIEAASTRLLATSSGSEGAQSAGQIADQAQGKGRAYGDYAAPALAAGAITAGIGMGSNKLFGDAATDLASGTHTLKGSLPARLGKEMFSEGVAEEAPQSAQEQYFTNVAEGEPDTMKGVGNAAGSGMVVGAAMGAGLGLRHRAKVAPAPAAATVVPAAASSAAPPNQIGPLQRAALAANAIPYERTPLPPVPKPTPFKDTLLQEPPENGIDYQGDSSMRGALHRKPVQPLQEGGGVAPNYPNGIDYDGRLTAADDPNEVANALAASAAREAQEQQRAGELDDLDNERAEAEASARAQQQAAAAAQQAEAARQAQATAQAQAEYLRTERLKRDSDMEALHGRLDAQQAASSRNSRMNVLDEVLGQLPDAPPERKLAAFSARLRREGYRNSAPTTEEMEHVARHSDLATALNTPEQDYAAPNELVNAVPERKAAPPNARASAAAPLPPELHTLAAQSKDATEFWKGLNKLGIDQGARKPLMEAFKAYAKARKRNPDLLPGAMAASTAAPAAPAQGAIGAGQAPAILDLALDEIRRPNGAIGTQGVTESRVREVLQHAAGMTLPLGASMRDMVEAFKADPQAQQRLRDFTAANPISAVQLPDQSLDLLDGHHRAFLLDQAGDRTVPATVKDYIGPSQQHAPGAAVEGLRHDVTDAAGQLKGGEWTAFAPDSGTLNVDRADMPQVKAEHRGPLVNFLNARGIAHEHDEVPASTLKPTQREFSHAKVQQAKDFDGGDRSVLVSSDNYVLDGHHQWLAKLEQDEPVKVIRLDAPMRELLPVVREFPSAETAEGAPTAEASPAPTLSEKNAAVIDAMSDDQVRDLYDSMDLPDADRPVAALRNRLKSSAPGDVKTWIDALAQPIQPGGFNAAAWNRERRDRIAASRAAGNTHLDQVPAYVEAMRGKQIYNVHDPKERGVIRTVSNQGDVVVDWSDEYSAKKNLAEASKEGKKTVFRTWLTPRDLRDYVVGAPRQIIEHNGTRIYPVNVRTGDEDSRPRWAVESAENKARRAAGERAIGGDSIHDTLEQAKTAAEREGQQAQDQAERQRVQQEQAEQAAAAERERKADTYNGYLVDKPENTKGLIRKALGRQFRFAGEPMTVRQRIESLAKEGTLTVHTLEEPRIKPMDRRAFNRANQAEQDAHERKMREAGNKTTYLVNGYDLGKLAFDYASYLLGQKPVAASPAGPAGAPALSIGKLPNTAVPITVRDGVVHFGDYPALDYDSGEAITVPQDATAQQIKDALLKGGAIGHGNKIFGMPKTETAPAAAPNAEENPAAALSDPLDAELNDALAHLGDVLGDVFGSKLNITGPQHSAGDLLPALSKVVELLVRKGYRSFSAAVGAAAKAMRGNAAVAQHIDQISARQWKAAYNAVAEYHDGTDSEEAVAALPADEVLRLVGQPTEPAEASAAPLGLEQAPDASVDLRRPHVAQSKQRSAVDVINDEWEGLQWDHDDHGWSVSAHGIVGTGETKEQAADDFLEHVRNGAGEMPILENQPEPKPEPELTMVQLNRLSVKDMTDGQLLRAQKELPKRAEPVAKEIERRKLAVEQQAQATPEQQGRAAFAAGEPRDEAYKQANNSDVLAWMSGYDAAKDDADAEAKGMVAKPSEYPTKEAAASYSGISHSGDGRARSDRDAFVGTVQQLYDEALPLAETEAQKQALRSAIDSFKAEYLRQTRSLIQVRSGTYSAHVAGRSGINTKQANARNTALDKALDRFSAWLKGAAPKVRQAVLDVRSPEQLAALQHAKDEKAAATQAKNDAFLKKLLNFTPGGEPVAVGKATLVRVNYDKQGLPSSLTMEGPDLVKGVTDKFDMVPHIYKTKEALASAVARVREGEAAPASQQDEGVPKRPMMPDPQAMELAREIIGNRFEADHKDYNALIAQARERGIPHAHLYFGPDSATARSVLDELADSNLRAAPSAMIERKVAKLRGQVDQSVAHDVAKFDPTHLGGPGAAGRQRDRARSSEKRNIIGGLADRLQAELDRREAAGAPSAPVEAVPTEAEAVTPAQAAEHIEDGHAEVATPTIIAASIRKSADNTIMNNEQARADLLQKIDAAIAAAGEDTTTNAADTELNAAARALEDAREAMHKAASKFYGEAAVAAAREKVKAAEQRAVAARKAANFIVFDVPGDGKFTVQNNKANLARFRDQVATTEGFKGPTSTRAKKSTIRLGTAPETAIHDMLDQGEKVAAHALAKEIGKPFRFTRNDKDGTPNLYLDVRDVTNMPHGITGYVGRLYGAKKTPWFVIENHSGMAVGTPATTSAAAVQLARDKLNTVSKEALDNGIRKMAATAPDQAALEAEWLAAAEKSDQAYADQLDAEARQAANARRAKEEKDEAERIARASTPMGKLEAAGFTVRGTDATLKNGNPLLVNRGGRPTTGELRWYDRAKDTYTANVGKVTSARGIPLDAAIEWLKNWYADEAKAREAQQQPAAAPPPAEPFKPLERTLVGRTAAVLLHDIQDKDTLATRADAERMHKRGMALVELIRDSELPRNIGDMLVRDIRNLDAQIAVNKGKPQFLETSLAKELHRTLQQIIDTAEKNAPAEAPAAAPEIPEGYRPMREKYYSAGVLTQGYAPHDIGDRVRNKETGHRGVVEGAVGGGPIFGRASVKYDNGVEAVTPMADLEAVPNEAVPAAPKIGDAARIDGIDMILADMREVDGVRYELYNANKIDDHRAVSRMVDVDTGEVIHTIKDKDYANAEAGFKEAVRRAEEVAAPAEPTESAAKASALVGSQRDPLKVNYFNPYLDGDIVEIGDKRWQVKQDMNGWYLTDTGNWRGTHPTIRNVKAMADLISMVDQAAREATPAKAAAPVQPAASTDNPDLHGYAYAIVKDGKILTSGSLPAPQYGTPSERTKLNHFKAMADEMGGDLYLGGYPDQEDWKPQDHLILGMTWQQIQDKQQGKRVALEQIKGKMPKDAALVYSAQPDKAANLKEADQKGKDTETFYAMPGRGMRFGKDLRGAILGGAQSRVLGEFSVAGGKAANASTIGKARRLADESGQPVAVASILDEGNVPLKGVLLQLPFQDALHDDFWNRNVLSEIGASGDVYYPQAKQEASSAAVEQSADDTLTPEQAIKQTTWRDLGQRDGVHTHRLMFNEEGPGDGSGSITIASVQRIGNGKWQVGDDSERYEGLREAKKAAIDVGIAYLRREGYVAKHDAPADAAQSANSAVEAAGFTVVGTSDLGGSFKNGKKLEVSHPGNSIIGEIRQHDTGKDTFQGFVGNSHSAPDLQLPAVLDWLKNWYKYEAPASEAKSPESAIPLGPMNLAEHDRTMEALDEGELPLAAYKANYERLLASEDAIKAELNAKTIPALLVIGGPEFAYRYKSDNKPQIVKGLFERMLMGYVVSTNGMFSYGMDGPRPAVAKVVNGMTAERLQEYATAMRKARAEHQAAREAHIAGLADPQTLDDFSALLNQKMREGSSFTQARLSLTPEQRVRFDELLADKNRAERAQRKVEKQEQAMRAPGEALTATETIKTRHTKHGHDLWQFNLEQRVSNDEFKDLVAKARRLGGDYSSYRGNGAIPGWQFKTPEAAAAFKALIAGDASAAQEVMAARRDAFADDKSQSAAERLDEMADRLEQWADESDGAERKTNTARRARFAAAAEAHASGQRALGRTMRNIATALKEGTAKYLDKVRQKNQVILLNTLVANARDAAADYEFPVSEGEHHRWSRPNGYKERMEQPPTVADMDHAVFPTYTAYRSDLARLGRQLQEVDGTKLIGKAILKVADDVSAAYLKFAKENLLQVSPFADRATGQRAIFTSEGDAEAAIARSGYRGKAIPFKEKNRLYRIILSPTDAIERGIWQGDGDKKITLKPEFGAELVEKVGRINRRRQHVDLPWQMEVAHDRRKLLARMGIESPAELRMALREFLGLKVLPKEPDRIKELERKMIGRAHDGLDFFPTPADQADEMIEAADIKPGMRVLEPSAGMGHIADRIREAGFEPDVVEMAPERRELLEAKGYNVVGNDFLDTKAREFYTYGDTFEAPDGTVGIMRGHPKGSYGRVTLRSEDGRDLGYFDRDELIPLKRNGNEMVDGKVVPRADLERAEQAARGDAADYMRSALDFYDRGDMEGAASLVERAQRATEDGEFNKASADLGERLRASAAGQYDRIIMNPPFSDRRDAQHVMHAYDLLKPGGRLVAIMGEGVFFGQDRHARAFQDWLEAHGGTSEKLAEGTFMDPSLPVNTGVNARMVVVDKPALAGQEQAATGGDALMGKLRVDPQVESPAFRAWFKDSKVTNPDDTPRVVYHGTHFPIEGGFRPGRHDHSAGIFFTDTPGVASIYASYKSGMEGANVVPAYLSLQNPLRIDGTGLSFKSGKQADWLAQAKASGHDGVIISNYEDGGTGGIENYQSAGRHTVYIAFHPEQVKSAVGNNGNFDPAEPSIIGNLRAAPGFYSELARQIAAVPDKQATMPADQWAAWLKANAGKLGIKKDEIEWSGITDYLALRSKDKVSRDDLGEYLNRNGVQVLEVLKTGTSGDTEDRLRDLYPLDYGTLLEAGIEPVVSPDGSRIGFIGGDDGDIAGADNLRDFYDVNDETVAAAERMAAAFVNAQEGHTRYGHGNLTLPGGENYRELLLTLPTKHPQRGATEAELDQLHQSLIDAGRDGLYEDLRKALAAGGNDAIDTLDDMQARMDIPTQALRDAMAGGDADSQYRSGHWDEANVLAHIRFNDRTDADGNRVLFIEELQSDWGQDGLKKGFRAKGSDPWEYFKTQGYRTDYVDNDPDEFDHPTWVVRDNTGDYVATGDTERGAIDALIAMDDGATVPTGEHAAGVPAAPFISGRRYGVILADGMELRSKPDAEGKTHAIRFSTIGEADREADKVGGSVRDLGYIADTKAWLSLGIKRMIRYAAENGYDRIAFVKGQQAVDRFDLQKHISKLDWQRQGDEFAIKAYPANAPDAERPVIEQAHVKADQLEKYVGKELAERIIDAANRKKPKPDYVIHEADPHGNMPRRWLVKSLRSGFIQTLYSPEDADKYVAERSGGALVKGTIAGVDLQVGGEGMKTFYDKIVPQTVNEVLKKLGGGKIGITNVVGTATYEQLEEAGERTGLSQAELDAMPLPERKALFDSLLDQKQPSFDITPELRARALDGLPLFSTGAPAASLDQSLYAAADRGTSAADLLNRIATESTDEGHRAIAAQMLAVGVDPTVGTASGETRSFTTGHLPSAYAAGYDPKAHHVALYEVHGTEQNLLHEFAHAATARALRAGGRAALQMKALYAAVKRNGSMRGMYGMADVDEFVAEAHSNAAFQAALQKIESGPSSMWARFVNIVRGVLGLPPHMTDMLARVLETGRDLMAENGKLADAGALMGKVREQIDAPGFRRWFGDSRVVDANGKPMVVYHGTGMDIEQFDGFELPGWFTEDPKQADRYTNREVQDSDTGEILSAPNIVPVYLSILNPLRLDMEMNDRGVSGAEVFARAGLSTDGVDDPQILKHNDTVWQVVNTHQFAEAAQAAGYDGIEVREGGVRTWAIFSQAQAKSAIGNSGAFDPAEPRIMGSLRDSLANAANDVREVELPAGYKVGDFLHRFSAESGRLSWWHKSLGTMDNLARRHPAFGYVYRAVQRFISDISRYANLAADKAPTLLPQLEDLRHVVGKARKRAVSAEDTLAISAPIFQGTLSWKRDDQGRPVKIEDLERRAASMSTAEKADVLLRNGVIDQQQHQAWSAGPRDAYEATIERKYTDSELRAGLVWTDGEMRSLFGLNADQIALYREFRSAVDLSLTNLTISEMVRMGGEYAKGTMERAVEARSLDSAALYLHDHFQALARMDPAKADEHLHTAQQITNLADKGRDLMDRGYAPLMRFGKYTVYATEGDQQLYFGMFESAEDAAQMARRMRAANPDATVATGTISEEDYKLFQGVSPETLQLFGTAAGIDASELFQQYLKLTKNNRSALKRLIHRKGVNGFSEDAGRVLASFLYSNARRTSSNANQGDIDEAVEAIPKGKGELKDAAVQLREHIRDPGSGGTFLSGLMFAQFLGGSVASAAVNLTQPLTMTLPYLSQFGGLAYASRELVAATRLAAMDSTGDDELEKALKLYKQTVEPQEIHFLRAQAAGKATLRAGDGTKAGNLRARLHNAMAAVQLGWGKMFAMAEKSNRRITFIAAYRIARERGNLGDPGRFAKDAVDRTQMVYNSGNKPAWARNSVGGLLMTFKQYSIGYLELMAQMAFAGKPGSPERAAGRRAVLYMLSVLFMMGGADGLPFEQDLEDAIDGLLQRLGYNFSTKRAKQAFLANALGDKGADFVLKGISSMPGMPIDVAGRFGMGNLIPGTGLLTKKASYTSDMGELFGPAGDLAKRSFTAAGKALGGNLPGAALDVSPLAVRNLVQGGDMLRTGTYRDARGYKVNETTPAEAAMKMIGFQPNSTANIQDAKGQALNMIAQSRLRSEEISELWAQGRANHDDAMVQEAKAMRDDWNAKNPEAKVHISMPGIVHRVRAMREDALARTQKTAGRALKDSVRRELAEVRGE